MRKITDMSYADLESLLKKNGKLADLVSEKTANEVIYLYEEDYLYGIHYSFRWGSLYKEFAFQDEDTKVADHLENMQNAFCFFSDECYKFVQRFIDLVRRYDKIGWSLSYEDDERLTNRINELRGQVEETIEAQMDADYEYAAGPEAMAEHVLTYTEDFDNYYEEGGKIFQVVA